MQKKSFSTQAIYLQVKFRRVRKIGLAEIQSFIGAMESCGPFVVGILICNTGFTKAAEEYLRYINKKIFLIHSKSPGSYTLYHSLR